MKECQIILTSNEIKELITGQRVTKTSNAGHGSFLIHIKGGGLEVIDVDKAIKTYEIEHPEKLENLEELEKKAVKAVDEIEDHEKKKNAAYGMHYLENANQNR